jgi:deazaflavin-dependent oxidoreductase (nitroreductase family)
MSVEKTAARDIVRVMNKHVLNPAMLHLAGRKHFYASTIHHAGRRSGKEYRTPVVAERVADGFLVPLPYGEGVDWVRNLLANGHGTLDHDGQTHLVAAPTIVRAATAVAEFPPRKRRTFERVGVKSYLHLNLADE